MRNNFWRDVTAPICHQKQCYVTVTFEGIRVSLQYQVSLLIPIDV